MKQPALSVIVAVHNEAPRLPDCMRSLEAQTFRDFEVLLVNNGSTDDSADVCRGYAERSTDERVRMFDLPNVSSLSAARNKGIREARGRYVTFVDADDWVEPEFLAEFFREPLPAQNGIVVLQGILLDYTQAAEPKPNTPLVAYTDAVFHIGDDPATAMDHKFLDDGSSASKLYDRETLLRHGIFFPEEMPSREDHVFYFRYLHHISTVVWRRGVHLHYMQRDRTTLSRRRHSATLVLRTVRALEGDLPRLCERFGITDRSYIAPIYRELVLYTLLRAVHGIGPRDYRETLRVVVEHRDALRTGPRWHHPILTPTIWRLLDLLPESGHYIAFKMIQLRRYTLEKRGYRL